MEYFSIFGLVAFVLVLSMTGTVNKLKKEVDELKEQLSKLQTEK